MNNEHSAPLAIATGVEMQILRRHEDDRGLTFLIRMQKGSRAPRHDHPGGEETYVAEGRLRVDGRRDAAGRPVPEVVLRRGEHFFAPPGEIHEGFAEEDVLLFVVTPGGVGKSG
jgi:quercetin dioxygenase-like cupin family protein